MNDPQILFEDVYFSYKNESEITTDKDYILSGVSVSIQKGEFVAVLGANGSGKSTFAKLTNALLVPLKGKVLIEGMDTSDNVNEFDIRKKIGLVFQNPDNQIVASIVEEDVAFGPENLGIAPKEIRKRVDEALKSVGMYEYRSHETHRLSGGQKQRVAIAGMIAMTPDCIVFDESTAMLDPQGRKEVMETAKRLNKELGITVLFITHFMDEAVQADRVIVISDGKIKIDGNPHDVFSRRDTLEECSLGIPVISEIATRLKKKGLRLPDDIIYESEFIDALKKITVNRS